MGGVPAPLRTGQAAEYTQCHLEGGLYVTGEQQVSHEGVEKSEAVTPAFWVLELPPLPSISCEFAFLSLSLLPL